MGYMLETRGLTKRFGRGDQAQDAVADVSLHIREGEVYGLLGPNGAGKSTTLKMICGMLRPTAGEILFAGHAWRREDLYAIGSLIEEAPLYPNLTARENLRVRTTLLGLPESRIDEVLAAVDLADTGKKRAGRFSMGMRQRLGLALALIARPRLLVLDEPTNGLDPIGIEELRDQIRGFAAAGTTVIVSSHILSEVQQMADTIGIICGGASPTRMRFVPGRTSRNSSCASAGKGDKQAGRWRHDGRERRPARGPARRGPEVAPRGTGSPGRAHGASDAAARRDALPGRADLQRVELLVRALPARVSLARGGVRRAGGRSHADAGASGPGLPARARLVGQGALVPRALHALEPCGLRHLPRGIGVHLAGPHGRGHAHDAPLRARQHGDRGVDDPRRLFLTARLGMLAGIFCPLAAQLVGGFAWSLVPLPQLFPPSANMVIPTSFIPVLPSGEPLAADMALGEALASDGMLTLAGLAVCALAFAALTAAGAAWFARSEER